MTLLRHYDLSWQFPYVELMLVSASTPVAQHKWWWRPQWGTWRGQLGVKPSTTCVKSGGWQDGETACFFSVVLIADVCFFPVHLLRHHDRSSLPLNLFSPDIVTLLPIFIWLVRSSFLASGLVLAPPDIPLVDVDRCEWGCRQVQLWLRSRVRGLAAVCGVDACTWTRDLLSSARLHASSSRRWRDEADRACTCKCLHASSARPLTPGYPAYSPPGGAGDNVRDVRPACAASSVCPGRVLRVTAPARRPRLLMAHNTGEGRAPCGGHSLRPVVGQRTCCSGHKARCGSHVTWWFSDR